MKRLNKLLAAMKKFSSKDCTARYIHGIKFDLNRRTVEATDAHAAVILHGSRAFVAKMANEYADYLGIEPPGDDFGVAQLAPAMGKKWPKAERLDKELTLKGDLLKCLRFEHNPADNKSAYVHCDQLPRLEQVCKALGVALKLIPGTLRTYNLLQYGTSHFGGEEIMFCLAQMPQHYETFGATGKPTSTVVTYDSLDEIDSETMRVFKGLA